MSVMADVDVEYDKRHGGAFDRGTCDSYYQRGFNPHVGSIPTTTQVVLQ